MTRRRAADALGCDLMVALIPRQPLQDMVGARRREVFNARFGRTALHMNLEGQRVSEDLQKYLLAEAEQAIPDSALWRKSERSGD